MPFSDRTAEGKLPSIPLFTIECKTTHWRTRDWSIISIRCGEFTNYALLSCKNEPSILIHLTRRIVSLACRKWHMVRMRFSTTVLEHYHYKTISWGSWIHSTLCLFGSIQCLFLSGFPTKIFYAFLIPLCLVFPILLDTITVAPPCVISSIFSLLPAYSFKRVYLWLSFQIS